VTGRRRRSSLTARRGASAPSERLAQGPSAAAAVLGAVYGRKYTSPCKYPLCYFSSLQSFGATGKVVRVYWAHGYPCMCYHHTSSTRVMNAAASQSTPGNTATRNVGATADNPDKAHYSTSARLCATWCHAALSASLHCVPLVAIQRRTPVVAGLALDRLALLRCRSRTTWSTGSSRYCRLARNCSFQPTTAVRNCQGCQETTPLACAHLCTAFCTTGAQGACKRHVVNVALPQPGAN
jgi:hypothetical protein